MGLLELCEQVFGTADLYQVLGVRREASEGEVRRGYHKVSLQVHPDRVDEDQKEDATRRFQILGRVYAVLSDKEQRAVYDEQGTVDEESAGLDQDRDWDAYWRLLFKKISLEDIQAFENTYKGSEEELADVKQAYLDFKGDMDQIMESVLCVQYTDEPRIRNIIQQAIDAKEVPSYNAFVKESKQKMNARKRRAQKEAKEAELSRKELGLQEGVNNLKALIQRRQVKGASLGAAGWARPPLRFELCWSHRGTSAEEKQLTVSLVLGINPAPHQQLWYLLPTAPTPGPRPRTRSMFGGGRVKATAREISGWRAQHGKAV
ncbi:DnaJ-like subfamily C member 9 [Cricetulus griseus]|uniref:DnaJ homolog subfamily C member 9 n=1 Tax=Cricetulus griseus TaxID=10029 RepID=G3I2P6_CRIGR|nr:DnaJ-like subfamily C member 9 [Cricetulus griseus]